MTKTCFVCMPIGEPGPDFEHFKGVFEIVIRPPLEHLGYTVVRGEQRADTGSVIRRVIRDLISSDLVIGDLTEFNPSVIYEIGIRQMLRLSGTLLIFDPQRSEKAGRKEIPFNFRDQRRIEYSTDFSTLPMFTSELRKAVETLASTSEDRKQYNVVRAELPDLPENLAQPPDDQVRQLLSEKGGLERQIAQYRARFGILSEAGDDAPTELSTRERIRRMRQTIDAGNSPPDIVRNALEAADNQDLEQFITAVEKLSDVEHFFPTSRKYVEIAQAASRAFDASELERVVLELARDVYPDDDGIRQLLLGVKRDGTAEEREEARRDVERELGIENGLIADISGFSQHFLESKRTWFLIYFDLLYRSREYETTTKLCDQMERQIGATPLLTREKARAIEMLEGELTALPIFKAAAIHPETDDTSAVWYGNTLNNIGRYVDAAEAYLLACRIDLNDGANFAHVIQSIARHERYRLRRDQTEKRDLPAGVGPEDVARLIIAAASATITVEAGERIRDGMSTFNIDAAIMQNAPPMTVQERHELVTELYRKFKSELTTDTAVNGLSSGPMTPA